MSRKNYYQRNNEVLNDRAKKYCHGNKEVLREKARNKYRELSVDEKNKKRKFERDRYRRKLEEAKQKS